MFRNHPSRALALVLLTIVPATLASAAPVSKPFKPETMFGATALSVSSLATETAQFGRMPIVRIYYKALPPATAWTKGRLAEASGSAVVVSFKALPSTVLSGTDDSALAHFFDNAPTGHPIYYSYYHEPESKIDAGLFTLADYKAAWARVVQIANAADNPFLHSTLILMAWDLDPASHRNWKDYLPSGGIISTLGWDAYPLGGIGTPAPDSFMAAAVQASKAANLPFGFAEFGTVTVTGRAAWLTAVANYIRKSGALFGSLYDSPINGGLGGSGTFSISDPASLNAWRAVVQDS
jgi:hypothetical protein